jgi:hypothetical protein
MARGGLLKKQQAAAAAASPQPAAAGGGVIPGSGQGASEHALQGASTAGKAPTEAVVATAEKQKQSLTSKLLGRLKGTDGRKQAAAATAPQAQPGQEGEPGAAPRLSHPPPAMAQRKGGALLGAAAASQEPAAATSLLVDATSAAQRRRGEDAAAPRCAAARLPSLLLLLPPSAVGRLRPQLAAAG